MGSWSWVICPFIFVGKQEICIRCAFSGRLSTRVLLAFNLYPWNGPMQSTHVSELATDIAMTALPPLRVSREKRPARSRISSAGAAGWSRDGKGARESFVYSSFRFRSSCMVVGVMPVWSSPLAQPSCAWWPTAEALFTLLLHGGETSVGHAAGVSLNKLVESLFLQDVLLFFSCSGGHHGGGEGVEKRRAVGCERLGSGSFSSAFTTELRRRPWPLPFCRGQASGSWLLVSEASPVTIMA